MIYVFTEYADLMQMRQISRVKFYMYHHCTGWFFRTI